MITQEDSELFYTFFQNCEYKQTFTKKIGILKRFNTKKIRADCTNRNNGFINAI